jgi:hypothetical protein
MVAVGPPGGGFRSPWARVKLVVRAKRRRVAWFLVFIMLVIRYYIMDISYC